MISFDTNYIQADINPSTFGVSILKMFDQEGLLNKTAKWKIMRKIRNILLDMLDTQYGNADTWENMTSVKKQVYRAYKQMLRDIPQTFTNVEDVVITDIPV